MSDQSPPATPEPTAPAPSTAPALRPSRALLWVLLVLGAFLALGALWFALFGSPQVVGLDTGAVLNSASATSTSGVATSTVPITADDVRAVLAQVDYVESSDASTTEYNNMITHAVAGVDLTAFARSTLESTSSIWWVEPSTNTSRTLTGAEKDSIVAEALTAWVTREQSVGETSTLSDLLGERMFPPDSPDRIRPDSLLEVIGQGLAPLSLMFGAHDVDNEWTWSAEQVSVTGRSTADVTYSASTNSNAQFKFVDPSVTYIKHLSFAPAPEGGWRLAGWSNYAEVRARFSANLTPPGSVTNVDEWWGSL